MAGHRPWREVRAERARGMRVEGESPVVHEDLRITGSVDLPPEHPEMPERRRLTIVNDIGGSVDVEVGVTDSALVALGGRDVDDWLEGRVLAFARGGPNDGRKLERLAAAAPIILSSHNVER